MAALRGVPYPEVRDAALGQFAELARVVGDLPDDDLALPTLLGDWTVAELVAHLMRNVDSVSHYLAATPPDAAGTDLVGYLSRTSEFAAAVAARAAEVAAAHSPAELRDGLRRAAVQASLDLARLGDDDGGRLVPARLGALTLADFLVTRCIEGATHAWDLATALDLPALGPPGSTGLVQPPALRVAVRALAALLAARHPGRAVEVRVPGVVAVQCGSGPRHARGTPGNVVEADPLAFLLLATGRLSWDEVVRTGQVRASGLRADFSAYVPLMS